MKCQWKEVSADQVYRTFIRQCILTKKGIHGQGTYPVQSVDSHCLWQSGDSLHLVPLLFATFCAFSISIRFMTSSSQNALSRSDALSSRSLGDVRSGRVLPFSLRARSGADRAGEEHSMDWDHVIRCNSPRNLRAMALESGPYHLCLFDSISCFRACGKMIFVKSPVITLFTARIRNPNINNIPSCTFLTYKLDDPFSWIYMKTPEIWEW